MPFQIVRNDITKMHVDAIVNTANPRPGYGAGIDSAVYEAAGKDKLLAKRHEIGPIEPGTSVITDGYNLPAKFIIHTVGTAWQGGKAGEEDIIRNCYRSVFDIAVNNDIASLAIPLLASGSYGFPKGIALRIALSEIEAFMSVSDMDVYLVVFDEKSVSLSSELYGDIDEYINDNYVEEKNQVEYPDSYGRTESVVQRSESFAGGLASIGAIPRFLKANKAEKKKKKGSNKKAESIEATFEEEEEMHSSDMCLSAPILEEERSLDDVVNNLDKTFMELVFSFADAKGLTDVEVQKKANLDRKAFSKLKCGTTKNPSKSTALALAVALELNLDETKDLLSRAGLALSPCSKQDAMS
jgi:O-acetyl-ADP-ribose deacetylase (regulator of RNase III)